MTIYRFLGDFNGVSGSVGYDNTDYGASGLLSDPDYVQYWYLWLDHGDRLDMSLHYRIHQPTTTLNDNTEAIWSLTFFGLNLDATPTGDHGDFIGDRTNTYWNSGVNDPSFASGYLPSRWYLFQEWNTFGSMEFTLSWVRTPLDLGPDHAGFVPSSIGVGGGGWNVGHA